MLVSGRVNQCIAVNHASGNKQIVPDCFCLKTQWSPFEFGMALFSELQIQYLLFHFNFFPKIASTSSGLWHNGKLVIAASQILSDSRKFAEKREVTMSWRKCRYCHRKKWSMSTNQTTPKAGSVSFKQKISKNLDMTTALLKAFVKPLSKKHAGFAKRVQIHTSKFVGVFDPFEKHFLVKKKKSFPRVGIKITHV